MYRCHCFYVFAGCWVVSCVHFHLCVYHCMCMCSHVRAWVCACVCVCVCVCALPDEVSKLQSHLSLLREEYVKLQNRFADLERRYQVAIAGSGEGDNEGSFVTRLLRIIADLYDKEQYRCAACGHVTIALQPQGKSASLQGPDARRLTKS